MEVKENSITKEMTINEVIKRHPGTLQVFHKYNIDSCCGGAENIERSAAAQKIDLGGLLKELNELA